MKINVFNNGNTCEVYRVSAILKDDEVILCVLFHGKWPYLKRYEFGDNSGKFQFVSQELDFEDIEDVPCTEVCLEFLDDERKFFERSMMFEFVEKETFQILFKKDMLKSSHTLAKWEPEKK